MNQTDNEKNIKRIAILGSTGSIGTQTLDIIEEHPERFKATVLTAGRNWELLARQARRFMPHRVVIAAEEMLYPLKQALSDLPIEVKAGAQAIADSTTIPEVDVVVTAMVGYSGLIPTIEAIKAGKTIALANKETLVVAGELITDLLKKYPARIVPVDSEHSAIFQCLQGENRSEMRKIILTASGGPFRTKSLAEMESVTVEDALHHPNWDMGAKVTIDSATMMNKGFEMIEARWLFDCNPEDIEIVVHPQSIVHSMVEYADGSVKAQLGTPDMHLPIRYALSYPERLTSSRKPLSIEQYSTLTFEHPDMEKFPLLRYAFEAISKGGNAPCVLNAANEIAVAAFLNRKIGYMDIPRLVRKVMDMIDFIPDVTLADLISSNSSARSLASELIND
ncbi:MAG: 1-deoxy-D-xylulose-5-phosphate reductoisomerase [Muribaculaceae bacterium]|nr:1-deoxy-D-xylulose-5-phosphate reductoisomerase [Muribaculaceae bacterium]